VFHEGVWPPPGEGAQLVDPILHSSSEVNLGGIVESVMGPSREGSLVRGVGGGDVGGGTAGAGVGESGNGSLLGVEGLGAGYGVMGGGHSRNVSGASQAPLLSSGTAPPSPTQASTPMAGRTATPARSSPLKDAVIRAGTSSGSHGNGNGQREDKMLRTQNWIERTLAR